MRSMCKTQPQSDDKCYVSEDSYVIQSICEKRMQRKRITCLVSTTTNSYRSKHREKESQCEWVDVFSVCVFFLFLLFRSFGSLILFIRNSTCSQYKIVVFIYLKETSLFTMYYKVRSAATDTWLLSIPHTMRCHFILLCAWCIMIRLLQKKCEKYASTSLFVRLSLSSSSSPSSSSSFCSFLAAVMKYVYVRKRKNFVYTFYRYDVTPQPDNNAMSSECTFWNMPTENDAMTMTNTNRKCIARLQKCFHMLGVCWFFFRNICADVIKWNIVRCEGKKISETNWPLVYFMCVCWACTKLLI